ncbi:MAG: hypothetical protein HWE27_10575 [Gammaproteobacteria bacterium]|nr:hypothetical protein [Gammaproteobacteria bacterium]
MKKYIALFFIATSVVVSAGSYTGKSKVKWLGTIFDDHFAIGGDWTNKLGCSKDDGLWKIYSVNNSMEELKVMYSTALAAYTSGNTIELYAHECGADGRMHARSMFTPSRTGN